MNRLVWLTMVAALAMSLGWTPLAAQVVLGPEGPVNPKQIIPAPASPAERRRPALFLSRITRGGNNGSVTGREWKGWDAFMRSLLRISQTGLGLKIGEEHLCRGQRHLNHT